MNKKMEMVLKRILIFIKLLLEKLRESRKQSGVAFPLLVYYGTNRLWAKSEIPYQKQLESIEMAYTNCLSANVDKKQFLSWYKTLEDEVKKFNKELDAIALKLTQRTIHFVCSFLG